MKRMIYLLAASACAVWIASACGEPGGGAGAGATREDPLASPPPAGVPDEDWADVARFRDANAALRAKPTYGEEPRVVFMGNSITEGWDYRYPEFFRRHPTWVNRGISGQTTPQMLVRFRPDVIALEPAAVVLLAGINDIAGNTGPIPLEDTFGNLASMAELAEANGIAVVIASVLPAYDFPWRPGLAPAEKVVRLNAMLRDYAGAKGYTYLDYFGALADERPGLRAGLHEDEVHPLRAGYAIMAPLTEEAVARALGMGAD